MISPETQLAFQLANGPGTIAVLLGSGISRSAGILSGWEVLVTLIQRIAIAESETPPVAELAEAWFERRTGAKATYSSVLQALAPTPTSRHGLLAPFFECSDSKPYEPTKAHHAIARLVAAGLVRVIITTNFDRLLEKALDQVGVTPRVVASPSQVGGMIPLAHARCTILKVHGDYQGGDLRNSDDEIGAYPPEQDALLDRVFDEYGLLVAGWSATWDHALRRAIERAPSRRYIQTWLRVGTSSESANQLTEHRQMRLIDIASADEFLPGLADTAIALQDARAPAPEDETAWVERQKVYLRQGPIGEMDHDQLVSEMRDRLSEAAAEVLTTFAGSGANQTDVFREQASRLEGISAPACALALRSARYGTKGMQDQWVQAIGHLSVIDRPGGATALLDLRSYPAVLCAYAFGVGAMLREDGEALARLWSFAPFDGNTRREPTLLHRASVQLLPDQNFGDDFLAGNGGRYAFPISERMKAVLTSRVTPMVGSTIVFERVLARLEAVWSLAMAVRSRDGYTDGFGGTHCYERQGPGEHVESILTEVGLRWILSSGCLGTTDAARIDVVKVDWVAESSKRRW